MNVAKDERRSQKICLITINYTETALSCIRKIAAYLRHNALEPKSIIAPILQEFEDKVTVFPVGCSISAELEKLGCIKYRECNTSTGYRILYSLNKEEKKITVHVILSQRENVQQLLFHRMIER